MVPTARERIVRQAFHHSLLKLKSNTAKVKMTWMVRKMQFEIRVPPLAKFVIVIFDEIP